MLDDPYLHYREKVEFISLSVQGQREAKLRELQTRNSYHHRERRKEGCSFCCSAFT